MTDIAQILGVGSGPQQEANGQLPPIASTHLPSRAMKMQGLSREMLDVMAGKKQDSRTAELPPAVPTKIVGEKSLVKVGTKWISTKNPARKWAWAPFTSSSRTDGLVLNHWVRANVEYPDYPYARFDIHLDPVVYSEDEYKAYLKDDSWTKSETDLLMDLARRFELRWPVIHDRWLEAFEDEAVVEGDHHPNSIKRNVEDLQHRYYSVAALLTQSRVSQEAAMEAKTLESTTPVDAELRENSNQLLLETAAARALASSDPEHQPLLHNLGSGSSNKVFDLAHERNRRAQMEALWNRTKQEELEEIELRKELKQVEARLRKLKKRGAHLGVSASNSANTSRAASPAVVEHAFAAPTPAPRTPYLQSGRLVMPTGVNKALLNRLEVILKEMKIPVRPLPTKQVCDLYDVVRKDALALLLLQKNALQKEGLVQAKRLKLAKMGGDVRVVDEETLMGITQPAAARKAVRTVSKPKVATTTTTTAATVAVTTATTTTTTTIAPVAPAAKPPKAATVAKTTPSPTSAPKPVAPAESSKEAEKKPRKPSVKRKRKPETTSGKALPSIPAAVPPAAVSDTAPTAPVVAAASSQASSDAAVPASDTKATSGKKRARKT